MSMSFVGKKVTAAELGVSPKKLYGNGRVKETIQKTDSVQDSVEPYVERLAEGAWVFLNKLKASGIDPDIFFKGAREAGLKARERGEI